MTAPLPDRMRQAAETIEELNALCGMGLNCTVSPHYLRAEAERMEVKP
jgi:hypothetical protein